jgi:general secretion pathway protein L
MRSIGLDIGDYSVKIVELVQNKKSVYISQYQEKILSQNVSKEDKELEVIEFVRAFLSTGDHSQDRWVVAVRQAQATTRFKTFPFSDRLKIQKSLSFEMEEDIPFDTDACVFESKVVQTMGSSADILATAIPRSHVEDIVDLASNFGVDIYAVTVEGLAFANLIENWEAPPPSGPANLSLEENQKPKKYLQVILNIGHKSTLLTAFENNRLVFTRSLYWGGSQLVQEIIRKNSISYVEAVKILQSQAYILLNKEGASFDQSQTSALLTKSIRDLTRDIQMTLLELQSEFNADITAVHYTGGVSFLPNLGAFLTQQLEIACNPIHLLQNYTGHLSASTEQLENLEARFTSAVAIALEGLKKPRNPATNLLKGDFAKQNKGLQTLWENWGTLIQIGAASLVVLFVWSYLRNSFSQTLADKGTEAVAEQAKSVARLPKKQANETGVRKYIKENKRKISEMKAISSVAQMNSALDLLKKVSEAAPGRSQVKVDIVRFNVRDDVVQIMGYANSAQDVLALSQGLKSLSLDGTVTNQPAGLGVMPNKTSFNLSFRTDRGIVK